MKVDEQWECGTLWPMKTEGTYHGGKGTTPETTACPEPGKQKWDQKKKEKKKKCIIINTSIIHVRMCCQPRSAQEWVERCLVSPTAPQLYVCLRCWHFRLFRGNVYASATAARILLLVYTYIPTYQVPGTLFGVGRVGGHTRARYQPVREYNWCFGQLFLLFMSTNKYRAFLLIIQARRLD